jgi:N-acetylglucosaminyldiphosphoundecaprenol N-acetyl-beta-D-mannosaminyltransferase
MDFETLDILGVPVARLDMAQTMEVLRRYIASGEPHLVVTADASGIAQAQGDPDLMAIYRDADLVTPDSIGVLWAARRQGQRLSERVSGVDIVERVCAESADRGTRIFFLGAAPGVAELAAEKLRLRFPGCNIVGTRHGYFPAESDAIVAQEVAACRPDVLFVAMGIPRQEKFIRATQDIIRAKVGIGVGGSLDVFSGRVKRAPRVIRAMRLEWLWRTLANPKKIRKAANLPKFVAMVLRRKS